MSGDGVDDRDVYEAIPTETWEKGNHVFILSSSGKPVYSRYGSEDRLATLSGVMQALVSFVQSSDDSIRRIRAGNTIIEFLVVEPVILVAVARSSQTAIDLRSNLFHLHNLLLSILTSTQLQKIYKERKNFDLRRLLAGSERLIDHLLDQIPLEPGFFLSAVPCIPIESSTRSSIANNIAQVCSKLKELVFTVLVLDGRIVCTVRLDRYKLHPADVLLILNLVNSTESFKSSETWTPLCLPRFDASGFLHAHVSYLADDCSACLLLLTVNKDIFYQLSEAKQRLVARLRKANILEALNAASRIRSQPASSLGIPELRHFIYVLPESGSYFSTSFEPPYDNNGARSELLAAYHSLHVDVTTKGLKLLFERRPYIALLACVQADLQLYLAFEPLICRDDAVRLVKKVRSWIGRQEDTLFMKEDFIF